MTNKILVFFSDLKGITSLTEMEFVSKTLPFSLSWLISGLCLESYNHLQVVANKQVPLTKGSFVFTNSCGIMTAVVQRGSTLKVSNFNGVWKETFLNSSNVS